MYYIHNFFYIHIYIYIVFSLHVEQNAKNIFIVCNVIFASLCMISVESVPISVSLVMSLNEIPYNEYSKDLFSYCLSVPVLQKKDSGYYASSKNNITVIMKNIRVIK